MRRILFLLLMPTIAFAQGARFDQNNVISASNAPFGAQTPIFTLPFSTVTVCAYPDDGGKPCGNPVVIYSDPALTQVADNPITADVHGRFGFWLAPGEYTYSVVTQTGTFAGTYIFTLGGTGGGSGCVLTGVPGHSVVFSPDGTTCSGNARFTWNPDASSAGIVNINGGAFLQIDGVDNSNNTFMNGDQIVLTNHGESLGQTAVEVNIDETTYTGSGTAPLAFNAVYEVDKAGHSGTGYLTTPSTGSSIAVNTMVGFQAGDAHIGAASSISKVYGFLATNGGNLATTEEYGFYAKTIANASISAGYCDFMARTQDGTPQLRASITCGPTKTSTFGGPVIAPTYQETLTTPASSSAACTAGQFTDDANFHYVCTATNTWKRVALTTF